MQKDGPITAGFVDRETTMSRREGRNWEAKHAVLYVVLKEISQVPLVEVQSSALCGYAKEMFVTGF